MDVERNVISQNLVNSTGIGIKSIAVRSDAEANPFEATSDIVQFFGALGLCRDGRNSQGIVIAKNTLLRCTVLYFICGVFACLGFIFRSIFTYWNEGTWRLQVYSELVQSILLQLAQALVIWSSVAENEDIVLRYYAELTRIDQALDIRNAKHYRQERTALNRRFFSFTLCYFIKMICEAVLWMLSFGLSDLLSFINDYLANMILMTSQFHFFVRMCIFKSRMIFLKKRLEADLKRLDEAKLNRNISNKDRCAKIIKKYKRCYILIHSQHNIIKQSYGLKITMSFIIYLMYIIRTTYAMLVYITTKTFMWAVIAGVVRMIPDTVLISALIVYIARIRRVRDRLLDKLEQLLCDQRTFTEMEQSSVLGLVELIHRQPLRFTAYDFFTLDMPLLCSLLNFIVTYIIILTQFKDPSESKRIIVNDFA